jgi:3-hydroxybutyryl-CoA dehydratase
VSIEVAQLLSPLLVDDVSAAAMERMAVILDDPNPIHLDADAVRALGLGNRQINQGPTGCGYLMNMLAAAFPGSNLRHFKVRFLSNVYAGDSLCAGGQVAGMGQQAGRSWVDCAIWLDVVDGGRAIEGTARVILN